MKSYNKDISNTIISYLDKAHKSISLNVPWFTSTILFEALLEAAKRDVLVTIIIEDDNINRFSEISHDDILKHNGNIFWHKKAKGVNHEKYCIIDNDILIYGSYNWTYYADKHNDESIIVMEKTNETTELINSFINNFESAVNSLKHSLKFEDIFSEEKSKLINRYGESSWDDLLLKLKEFDDVDAFSCNLSRIHKSGYFGFINTGGNVTIAPIYDEASYFEDDLAIVRFQNNWGIINNTNKTIHSFIYDSIFRNLENDSYVGRKGDFAYTLYTNGKTEKI